MKPALALEPPVSVTVGPAVCVHWYESVSPGSAATTVSEHALPSSTGLGDGAYTLGTLDVAVASGGARLADGGSGRGSIAGSTSTLADCVGWAVEVAGVPEADVLTAATTTPASVLST